MPSVIVLTKTGVEVSISSSLSLVDAVYNKGWLPKTGTVAANFAAVEGGSAPVESVNEHVTLADLQSGSSPAAVALRAASVAALEGAETVAPTGAWDFTEAPTVAGEAIGGGFDADAYVAAILARWTTRRQAAYDRDNALGFTHYIDSVGGLDSNTGLNPAQAWQTLGKLTTAGIAAGARIGLKRGSTFTGNFTVPTATGTLSPTSRVTFGAYGHGALPIVNGTFTIAQPYIDVQDINFRASSGYALFIFNGTTTNIGNQVRRCELGPAAGSGGIIAGIIGGLVEDCYFHDIWNNVEYPGGNGYATLFTTGSDGTEVRYNLVRNCYKGLGAGNTHRSLLIHHNIVDKARVNGIDLEGGTSGAPPRVINNFVWHRPTTPNGHGIDTQSGTAGPIWRNNVVYSDYSGVATNVQLYCIASTAYPNTDVDYNLGFIAPGSSGVEYAKLGTSVYATLALYKTAIAATSYLGKEVHSIAADPLLVDVAGGVFVPLPGSPCIDAGVVVPGATDLYLGAAPDLGPYEVA